MAASFRYKSICQDQGILRHSYASFSESPASGQEPEKILRLFSFDDAEQHRQLPHTKNLSARSISALFLFLPMKSETFPPFFPLFYQLS
jgi:hypothetical protein